MSKRGKNPAKPQKVTDYYAARQTGRDQDGAGSPPSSSARSRSPRSGSPMSARTSPDPSPAPDHRGENSPPPTPSTRSPAKPKRPKTTPTASQQSPHVRQQLHETPSLDAFPSTSNPISAAELKDMLISLRVSLQQDMTSMIDKLSATILQMSTRISHAEDRLSDLSKGFNSLVDQSDHHASEIQWLKMKCADLEDRSRRNNIKFRGIPESITPAQLRTFLLQLIKAMLPDAGTMELIIDRAHRLPKPTFLSETVPRDVLARIHFYHIKEQLMASAKQLKTMPPQFAGISLFADLSQTTIAHRRKLAPISTALRNHHIMYKWGFPTKLLITYNGKIYPIASVEKGLELLAQWKVPIPPASTTSRPRTGSSQRDWT